MRYSGRSGALLRSLWWEDDDQRSKQQSSTMEWSAAFKWMPSTKCGWYPHTACTLVSKMPLRFPPHTLVFHFPSSGSRDFAFNVSEWIPVDPNAPPQFVEADWRSWGEGRPCRSSESRARHRFRCSHRPPTHMVARVSRAALSLGADSGAPAPRASSRLVVG